MHKGLIAFVVVAGIGFTFSIIFFMKKSADKARKESDKILKEFKTIDKDLKKSSITFDSLNTGTGALDTIPQNTK